MYKNNDLIYSFWLGNICRGGGEFSIKISLFLVAKQLYNYIIKLGF